MKADLLKIYARSNLTSLSNYFIIAAVFVAIRIKWYGLPLAPEAFFAELGRWAALFLLITVALLRTRDLYRKLQAEHIAEEDANTFIFWIAALKLFYMTLWLYFLFMPLNGPLLYQHLVGYFFILCAMGMYASTSAAYLPLFLWDIGIQLGFAFFMLWKHQANWEAPYLAGILVMFGLYSFLSGYNLTKTTRQLVDASHALKKAAGNANRANRSKSDFLSVMSHEIRTPMTGILGMVDFLSETKLTPEQKSCVDAITECSKTLLNTLNDILDLSKMEAGKLKISNINFDLPSVLENVAKIMQPVAQEKGLPLRLKIDETVPRYAYGDPHRLRQVVMNLLNNAIKFTEEGFVELQALYKDHVIHIEVKDTGIGIDPENASHLFKSFAQADNSISRKYGGSGLGLAIAKQLTEMMGGKIGATSHLGEGSTFWIELPYREPIAEKRKDATREKLPTNAPKNILLVEDNHINQMICTRLLAQKGHHVTLATNGHDALEMIKKGGHDLVLMDCSLPGKSGIDITREIRALGGAFKRLPIVALTANAMEDHFRKCIDAGMNDVVIKPYEPETLYKAIASYGEGAVSTALNDKLKVLAEEMGPEYTAQLIQSVLEEIDNLAAHMTKAYKGHKYEELQNFAHDLKSVAGSVGLQKTQNLAAGIEKACLRKEHAHLAEEMAHLMKALQAEKSLLK